jgi:cytochrome c553
MSGEICWPPFPPETAAQRAVIEGIVGRLFEDECVLAAWLPGSFGQGRADRYSDVDMEALASDEGFASLQAEAGSLYARGGRVVEQFGGQSEHVFHHGAFYDTCVILDLKVTRQSALPWLPDPATVHVLFDKVGAFESRLPAPEPDAHAAAQWTQYISQQCRFFWVYAYTATRFLKRGDVSFASGYLATMRGVFAQLLWLEAHPGHSLPWMAGWGPVRTDLTEAQREVLAEAWTSAEREQLGEAIMQTVETCALCLKRIAQTAGAAYPDELEAVVRGYVQRELNERSAGLRP